MVICSYCQAQQLDGTIFCTVCGASLLSAPPQRQTTASLNRSAEQVDPETDQATILPAPSDSTSAPAPTLVVLSSGRRITLPVAPELLIGRKEQQRGFFPDVDFSLDGGYDAGVSRRHARLLFANGFYAIEDLGSSNGTFLNRHRLAPGQPTPLRAGDELQFGMLLVRFELS